MQSPAGSKSVSPAAVLVRLALDRWAFKSIRADNVSVIVVSLSDCSPAALACDLPPAVTPDWSPATPDYDAPPDVSTSPTRMFGSNVDLNACRRTIFRRGGAVKRLGGRSQQLRGGRELSKHVSAQSTSKQKSFRIPVTPEQRRAYCERRPALMGLLVPGT
jgi:hypothetical protein